MLCLLKTSSIMLQHYAHQLCVEATAVAMCCTAMHLGYVEKLPLLLCSLLLCTSTLWQSHCTCNVLHLKTFQVCGNAHLHALDLGIFNANNYFFIPSTLQQAILRPDSFRSSALKTKICYSDPEPVSQHNNLTLQPFDHCRAHTSCSPMHCCVYGIVARV